MTNQSFPDLQPSMFSPSASETLKGLEVGDACSWPVEKVASIRTLACQLGLQLNRYFRCKTDRKARMITVTRMS